MLIFGSAMESIICLPLRILCENWKNMSHVDTYLHLQLGEEFCLFKLLPCGLLSKYSMTSGGGQLNGFQWVFESGVSHSYPSKLSQTGSIVSVHAETHVIDTLGLLYRMLYFQ